MSRVRAVLDACVLVPEYLRDTLLLALEAELYKAYWSQKIFDEMSNNLVKRGVKTVEQAKDFEAVIIEAFPEAMVEVPDELENIMTNHPKDRHVLAAAVRAKAEVIVTSNLKDFQSKDLASWNIEAQSPDDFLSRRFDEDSEEMLQVIQRQSMKYKRPKMTVLELLDFFIQNKVIPKFAKKVLLYEYGEEIVQTAKKALNFFGTEAPEGIKLFEGERYQLWQKGKIFAIAAKDGRGEILRFQDGQLKGNLSSEDVQVFQNYEQRLEEEIAKLGVQQQEKDDFSFE